MKAILVTRHDLLPEQERELKEAGIEIVERTVAIPTDPKEFRSFVESLKSKGIEAIVSTGLPPHLIVQIQRFFTVILAKMELVKTVESEEEAKKIQAEAADRRAIIPAALGEKKSFRIMEHKGFVKVKITIEEEPLLKK